MRLIHGDCLDVLPTLPSDSVEACVTDPPYGLAFMGKDWDAFQAGDSPMRRRAEMDAVNTGMSRQGGRQRASADYQKRQARDMAAYQDAMREVFAEVARVLKPGAHLVTFGGTRTYHRLACAIEDAGFEVRDCLMWIYGSGFPKSLDVSKAIDKAAGAEREVVGRYELPDVADGLRRKSWGLTEEARIRSDREVTIAPGERDMRITAPATDLARQWAGWGTALKPAYEPILLARKPLAGTVAANVQQYGTGAINVDGCRVGTDEDRARPPRTPNALYGGGHGTNTTASASNPSGRWPANVLHDGSDEVVGRFPVTSSTGGEPLSGEVNRHGIYGARHRDRRGIGCGLGDTGSAARFFYTAKASRSEREAGLEHLPPVDTTVTVGRDPDAPGTRSPRAGAGNCAGAPIYVCAVCGLHLRGGLFVTPCTDGGPHWPQLTGTSSGRRNHHPTVKPLALMRWLVRLVTPPGGTVLDPFCGSGTTLLAARAEGAHAIGIEREAAYVRIAEGRLGMPLPVPDEQESEVASGATEVVAPQQPRLF